MVNWDALSPRRLWRGPAPEGEDAGGGAPAEPFGRRGALAGPDDPRSPERAWASWTPSAPSASPATAHALRSSASVASTSASPDGAGAGDADVDVSEAEFAHYASRPLPSSSRGSEVVLEMAEWGPESPADSDSESPAEGAPRCPPAGRPSPEVEGDVSKLECRYCFEPQVDAEADPLIHPCLCKGSAAVAHTRCIQRWTRESKSPTCEICKGPLIVAFRAPAPGESKRAVTAEEWIAEEGIVRTPDEDQAVEEARLHLYRTASGHLTPRTRRWERSVRVMNTVILASFAASLGLLIVFLVINWKGYTAETQEVSAMPLPFQSERMSVDFHPFEGWDASNRTCDVRREDGTLPAMRCHVPMENFAGREPTDFGNCEGLSKDAFPSGIVLGDIPKQPCGRWTKLSLAWGCQGEGSSCGIRFWPDRRAQALQAAEAGMCSAEGECVPIRRQEIATSILMEGLCSCAEVSARAP